MAVHLGQDEELRNLFQCRVNAWVCSDECIDELMNLSKLRVGVVIFPRIPHFRQTRF